MTDIAITTKIWIILFFICFMIMTFFMVKLWLEIIKFKKINNFQSELTILRSQYFLNRMNQIYDLTIKNKKYKKIFIYFFEKYKKLFTEELIEITDAFLTSLETDRKSINVLVGTLDQSEIYQKFDKLKAKIDNFNSELNYISSWQNFSIEQLNFFDLTISKAEEELEKSKLTMKFDVVDIENEIKQLKKQINLIHKKIEEIDFELTYVNLKETSQKLPIFIKKLFLWLKLIVFLQKKIPEAELELKKIFEISIENKKKNTVQEINQNLKSEINQIELMIKNFSLVEAEQKLIYVMENIQETKWELKNKQELKKILSTNLKLAQVNFDFAKKEFASFKKFISVYGDLVFFNKQKRIEFKQFNNLIKSTQSIVDELIIFEEDAKEQLFFIEAIKKLKKILSNTIQLINNYERIQSLFMTEKKHNQNLFFVILNLKVIFEQRDNFYLKKMYYSEYQKAMIYFLKLKNQQQLEHQSITKFINNFNQLKSMIDNLQISIQNTVLLREIANQLLVKSNKFRFSNDFLKNKILNTEIFFAKNNYKNVIETLLEIHEGKYTQWITLI